MPATSRGCAGIAHEAHRSCSASARCPSAAIAPSSSGPATTPLTAEDRLLASCDLDWLIAGPGIIANSAAVPLAAIYEVRRAPRPLPGVSLELAVWAGGELTHVLTPDPADLRDMAATEEPEDDNVLFADR